MSEPLRATITLEFEHVSGPEMDEDTVVDWFAAEVGRQNGAKKPFQVRLHQGDLAGPISVYQIKLVE